MQGTWYSLWDWGEAIDARQGTLNITLAVANTTNTTTNATTFYAPAHVRQEAAAMQAAGTLRHAVPAFMGAARGMQ